MGARTVSVVVSAAARAAMISLLRVGTPTCSLGAISARSGFMEVPEIGGSPDGPIQGRYATDPSTIYPKQRNGTKGLQVRAASGSPVQQAWRPCRNADRRLSCLAPGRGRRPW